MNTGKPPKRRKPKNLKVVPKKVKDKTKKRVEVPEVFTRPKFDLSYAHHIFDEKYKKLVIKFGNGKECEIDLIDTPMLKYWVTCHLHNKQRVNGFWTRKSCIAFHTNKEAEKNKDNHPSPKLINDAIDEIKKITGVEWPIRAYNGMGQEECNILHRFFTTSEASFRNFQLTKEQEDRFFHYKTVDGMTGSELWRKLSVEIEDVYKIKKDQKKKAELEKLFHIVNNEVHRYEDGCYYSHRSDIIRNRYEKKYRILDVDWNNRGHLGQVIDPLLQTRFEGKSTKNRISSFEPIKESLSLADDCNVFQIKGIRGKDYLSAYQQYDNPRCWDINTTTRICGGLTLDQDYTTTRFLNSEIFKHWLKKNNHPHSAQTLGLIPIGKIKSCPDLSEAKNIVKELSECETQWHSETCRVQKDWSVIDSKFYK